MNRLLLTRKIGESIEIDGGKIQVKFLEVKDKFGNKVIRVRIKAHPSVSVSKLGEVKEDKSELSVSESEYEEFDVESKSKKAKDVSK